MAKYENYTFKKLQGCFGHDMIDTLKEGPAIIPVRTYINSVGTVKVHCNIHVVDVDENGTQCVIASIDEPGWSHKSMPEYLVLYYNGNEQNFKFICPDRADFGDDDGIWDSIADMFTEEGMKKLKMHVDGVYNMITSDQLGYYFLGRLNG